MLDEVRSGTRFSAPLPPPKRRNSGNVRYADAFIHQAVGGARSQLEVCRRLGALGKLGDCGLASGAWKGSCKSEGLLTPSGVNSLSEARYSPCPFDHG